MNVNEYALYSLIMSLLMKWLLVCRESRERNRPKAKGLMWDVPWSSVGVMDSWREQLAMTVDTFFPSSTSVGQSTFEPKRHDGQASAAEGEATPHASQPTIAYRASVVPAERRPEHNIPRRQGEEGRERLVDSGGE